MNSKSTAKDEGKIALDHPHVVETTAGALIVGRIEALSNVSLAAPVLIGVRDAAVNVMRETLADVRKLEAERDSLKALNADLRVALALLVFRAQRATEADEPTDFAHIDEARAALAASTRAPNGEQS